MDYRNILIVKLSAIGDVIHALPVVHALKQQYPSSKITWIVEQPAFDLLAMNANIDEIIVFDKPKFKSLSGFIKHSPAANRLLKSRHFDLALDLQGLFKSAALTWLSGARKKLGYCNMRELSWLVSKPVCGATKNGHVIERYLDVARHLGCEVTTPQFCLTPSQQDIEETGQILEKEDLHTDDPYVVMAPGTNWESKCWPVASYSALAKMLWGAYRIPSIVIGGPKDREMAAEMQLENAGHMVDLTGKTNLKQLAYLLQKSRLFIGGDTGPMHLAVAMDTRVVALFGPSDATRNGPFGSKHVVIRKGLDCSPCFKRTCPHIDCMTQITAEEVLHVIAERHLLSAV